MVGAAPAPVGREAGVGSLRSARGLRYAQALRNTTGTTAHSKETWMGFIHLVGVEWFLDFTC
jgi:hypothetical protein